MSTLPSVQRVELERIQWGAMVVGASTLLVCFVGAPFSPDQFFRAYLAAYQFCLGIPLGCLVILMLYHITGGAWGFLLRRFLEAGTRTLPLMAVLFIPIAYGVRFLYPWARPEVVASNAKLQYKEIYLNVPFFWGRALLFFFAWIVLAFFLSSWSRQQDRTGEVVWARKFRLLSAPGMVIYGLTITFASVDWVMSLQPMFHSTIWGPLFATGQLISAQAFVVLILGWLAGRTPLREQVSLDVLSDIGNLLFTFLIFWSYLAFFQFLLIWMANLPEEAIWYLPRARAGWQWVAGAIFMFHFAVPFFLLLSRDLKRNLAGLMRVSALILFMHLVFMYWEIQPAFPENSLSEHWMDFLTPLGIGGIWLAYFLWQLKRYPVLPRHDLNQEEVARLRRLDQEEAARQEAINHG